MEFSLAIRWIAGLINKRLQTSVKMSYTITTILFDFLVCKLTSRSRESFSWLLIWSRKFWCSSVSSVTFFSPSRASSQPLKLTAPQIVDCFAISRGKYPKTSPFTHQDYHPLQAKLFMMPISLAAPVLLESGTLSDPSLVNRSTTFSIISALSSFDSLDSSKDPRGTLSFVFFWASMCSYICVVILCISRCF